MWLASGINQKKKKAGLGRLFFFFLKIFNLSFFPITFFFCKKLKLKQSKKNKKKISKEASYYNILKYKKMVLKSQCHS